MSVHYKFKNNLDHDTVTFDGLSISVADLKKSILHQKKIGKSSDFDLQITNAQTKEVYDNDETLVPKNTSVIVSRVPVQGGTKNKSSDKPDLPLPIDDDDYGLIRYDRIVKNADLVNANSTEEDKVKAMITQSSQEYDPSKYVKSRSMTGPLPPSYTCFRCGKQGHWIKNCPTNNPDVKRSTGIPRSFMVPVDGPEHKGALLTSSGDYAVPLIDHQAYKEVKKEKPPFVPQDEPVVEPEPEVPEELLCMVCNDLLQDAVLIPCCGNSFCDECVRQVLLESDNHECPVCHETEVSPNTLIPNRFLRTAVANYRNERGKVSTSLVRKAPPPAPVAQPASPATRRVDSPQPSPDSTVESQSHAPDTGAAQPDKSPKRTETKNSETKDAPVAPLLKLKSGNSTPTVCHTPENATPKRNTETDSEDAQPGTPLADEPPVDVISHHHHHHHHLPIQTIGHEHYSSDRYEHSGRYSRSRREDYGRHYNRSDNQDHNAISTIETITNMRNKCKFSRPAPPRSQFLNQRSHRDDRPDYDHDDYHGRYEKKHERSSRRTHYDRSDRESRYTSSSHEYPSSEHEHSDSHYDVHQHEESSSRRHVERYRSSPPRALLMTPAVPASAIYTAPVPAVPPLHPPVILPPAPQVFAPQPPPPGASPINTAQIPSQPPPPGVGPPMLPLSSEAPPPFGSRPFDKEDPLKDPKKDERSIDDRMEEFQRKLQKRDRDDEYSRDRSRSRSSDRHRSRSSSRSWSRSETRSSSRSRSRTPFSRSRTRSFSHSRSRSWSKKRSYSRSRSRTRTKSRSRSRSRNDSRARRRGGSRDTRQWSPRSRGRSHSFSPKGYRPSSRRNESYAMKHPYNPPQFPAVSSYQSQYGPPPPAIIPLTVMRPPAFPPHHMHTLHPPPIQPMHSRPIEPYPPVERSMKYPSQYGGQYPGYDAYSQKYQQPKYDREQRFGDHRGSRYDRRSEYQRNEEEVHHRIPGWVGDRSRDYKPRYRNSRDIRGKEIRELPHIPEEDVKVEHAKESSVETSSKKKEEKVSSKHKKHHHHHKSKETKKQEGKSSRTSVEEHSDSSKNLVKVEEKEDRKLLSESDSKTSDKVKDKKHKHKKHKTGDPTTKKKRSSKKEKVEVVSATDGEAPPTKVKVKKKKLKVKPEESVKDVVKEKVPTPVASPEEKAEDPIPAPEVPEEETTADKPSQDSDVLDIFAEDPEPEAADSKAETVSEAVVEENVEVADNVEMMETGNIEETINSEEEVEELIEDENVLRVDVPGISKWEREESEGEDEESTAPQRRGSVVVSAEESGPISSDIISRAENVLLSKQFKPRIESKDDKNSRDSSEASSGESTPVKRKEAVELKSVVNSEQLHSDSLQVIVSNKDKRSVYSRKEEGKSSKSEILVPKRSRSEKSAHRYYDEPRRPVAAYSSREERIKEYRDKGSDRREPKYSPPWKGRVDDRIPMREHKEYIRRPERDVEVRDDTVRRDERKRRFESTRGGDQSSSHDRKKDHSESRKRQDQELLKYTDKGSRSENYKKFRAGSMESSRDSFDSYGKRGEKRQPVEERHKHRSEKGPGDNQESNRRRHSPIKAPGTENPKPLKREYHDELKFEPDYDEFSDVEEKRPEVKEKPKKRADSSPEIKRAKVEKPSKSEMKPRKPEKSSVSSSSSAVSESDSSDSDEPKGKSRNSDTDHKQKHKKSKHKKHKKHKHKHKKKKSHKSKRD